MVYPRGESCPEIKKSDQAYFVKAIEQDVCLDFKTGVAWKEEHIRFLSFQCGLASSDQLK